MKAEFEIKGRKYEAEIDGLTAKVTGQVLNTRGHFLPGIKDTMEDALLDLNFPAKWKDGYADIVGVKIPKNEHVVYFYPYEPVAYNAIQDDFADHVRASLPHENLIRRGMRHERRKELVHKIGLVDPEPRGQERKFIENDWKNLVATLWETYKHPMRQYCKGQPAIGTSWFWRYEWQHGTPDMVDFEWLQHLLSLVQGRIENLRVKVVD